MGYVNSLEGIPHAKRGCFKFQVVLDSEQRRVRLDELGRKRRASGVAVIPLATYLGGLVVGKVPFIF